MDHDTERIDEAILALLYLTSFEEHGVQRAWKSHDWDALDRLHERGLVGNPRSKAKSVVLTEEGAARSRELFERLFAKASSSRPEARAPASDVGALVAPGCRTGSSAGTSTSGGAASSTARAARGSRTARWRSTGKSIYEIRAGAVEDWSHWLAKRGIAARTRRNVLGGGGLRSFVTWLERRELIDTIPRFPEVPVDEYAPTLISARVPREILDQIAWERRGAFLAARLGIRPGEIRAADVTDYRVIEGVAGLTISRAVKGPNANAPTRGTKGRSAAWIPVDEELQRWIEWRLFQVSKEEILRSRIALFPNPTARNREKRWIANALREGWNRAAARAGVRVRMYESTQHSSATAWLAQGSSLQMIQRMLRHADSRSTERYAKLGDLALVDVIRPRGRRNVDPVGIRGETGLANPLIGKENWRGGRDSNPQLPA